MDEESSPRSDDPTTSAPADSAATPDVEQTAGTVRISDAQLDQETLDTFGRDRVAACFRQTTQFAAETAFDPELLHPSDGRTVADYAGTETMTPSLAQEWKRIVRGAIAGDNKAGELRRILQLNNLVGDGIEITDDGGPIVVNETITESVISVDHSRGEPRLALVFKQHADLRVTKSGQPMLYPVDKEMSMWLAVPGATRGGPPCLLDGYLGTTSWDTLKADLAAKK